MVKVVLLMISLLLLKDENILATPVHLRVWQQSESPKGELIEYTEREHGFFPLPWKACQRLRYQQVSRQNHPGCIWSDSYGPSHVRGTGA